MVKTSPSSAGGSGLIPGPGANSIKTLKIIHIKKKIFKKKKHHHSEVSLHTHHNSLNEKDKNHQILAKVLNQY